MVSRGLGRRNEDLVKKTEMEFACFFLQFVKCGILPSEWLQQSGGKKLGSEWSGKSPTKTALNEVWEFEISGLNSQDCFGLVSFPHCLTGLIHLGLVWSRFHLNVFFFPLEELLFILDRNDLTELFFVTGMMVRVISQEWGIPPCVVPPLISPWRDRTRTSAKRWWVEPTWFQARSEPKRTVEECEYLS